MPPLTYHPADGELMRRILAESDVARRPERPPVTAYLGAWMEAAIRWIAAFFEERANIGRIDPNNSSKLFVTYYNYIAWKKHFYGI
jgi:hypothetical protein